MENDPSIAFAQRKVEKLLEVIEKGQDEIE